MLSFGAAPPPTRPRPQEADQSLRGRAGAGWRGPTPSQGTSHPSQNCVPHKPAMAVIALMTAPWRALATGRAGCFPLGHCLRTAVGAELGDMPSRVLGRGCQSSRGVAPEAWGAGAAPAPRTASRPARRREGCGVALCPCRGCWEIGLPFSSCPSDLARSNFFLGQGLTA